MRTGLSKPDDVVARLAEPFYNRSEPVHLPTEGAVPFSGSSPEATSHVAYKAALQAFKTVFPETESSLGRAV